MTMARAAARRGARRRPAGRWSSRTTGVARGRARSSATAGRMARGPELTSTATAPWGASSRHRCPGLVHCAVNDLSSVQYRERTHPGHRPDQAAPDQDAEDFVNALVVEVGGIGRSRVVGAEPEGAALPAVRAGDPPAGEIADHGARAAAGR